MDRFENELAEKRGGLFPCSEIGFVKRSVGFCEGYSTPFTLTHGVISYTEALLYRNGL